MHEQHTIKTRNVATAAEVTGASSSLPLNTKAFAQDGCCGLIFFGATHRAQVAEFTMSGLRTVRTPSFVVSRPNAYSRVVFG